MTTSQPLSIRARLTTRASALTMAGAMLVAGGAAWAQEAPNPGAPTANTAAPASAQSAPQPADGRPQTSADPDPAATGVATATAAPQADEQTDIVVTGIRASLASSAKIKRDSTLIVDSVSAEDVGKLPDVSIADSLARLPGVTAQRLEGRDQRLSIRGLGPDFSTTLLNGREQVTVGDNRGVEYDQYPSEFFKNVNVFKSADASLIASGISGTVDLRMLRPLDQSQRVFAVNARGQMNGLKSLNPDSSRYGYRGSATYVDQFADDTFGVALGVSATQTPSQDERYNAWGYNPDANGNQLLSGAKPYVQSNELKRYGAVATLEWEPSDSFHSTFDALYSHFQERQILRGIEFPLSGQLASATNPTGTVVTNSTASDGFVTGATFSNVFGVQRNDYNKRKADNYSLGWNNDLRLTDSIHLNVDASWSHAKRTDFLLETNTGTGFSKSGRPDTVTISQNDNGTYRIVPTLDYTNTDIFKLTDPQGWGNNGNQQVVQTGFLNRPSFKDDLKSLRASLNGEFEGSVVKGWEVGGNYSRRKKTSAYTSYFLCPKGAGTGCTVASGTPLTGNVPQEALLGENVALDYLGIPQMLTLDPLYIYNNSVNAAYDNRPSALVRDNSVTENVYTGYAKITLDGEVGGKTLKGSLGGQVVHSQQRSDGQIASVVGGNVTVAPASQKVNYTNFLPSATMSVELIPSGFIKMGASQTMVRPRLDQERVTQDVAINTGNIGQQPVSLFPVFTSTGGNVALRPYQSTNIDLSFEKYFTGGGYVALSGYFKHLTDFVDPNNSYAYDFTPLLSALTPAQQAAVIAAGQTTGNVSSPANTGRGEVLGLEGTLSLPFKAITSALDGFGIFATGNYTQSTIKFASNPAEAITLPGLSKYTASGTVYFEKWGFQARANYRYRSSFLAEVAGLSATPTYRTARSEGILDAQIGYEFQEGFLKGFSILAQGKNLTDRPFVTYNNGDSRQVIDYQRYGRDYYIGLTYKF
ncbi:iron complex outermembrane recepter protein [Sphingomonas gellani]|uniref:Iron complex outermembrane recepter protein n=1 Tax=Sphingomonas gellani TaxID=1166340 RepID=A0A1H8CU90_9SPHN|nr:TonB-dependent receptor [Sphingomonas gellani]SEM98693.1 iron complex outermembrane recepter protein [Sphingomonas gellani]